MKKIYVSSIALTLLFLGCKTESSVISHNIGNLKTELIFVKGGTYQMGSEVDSDEQPVHKVTVGDFYISKIEVTQELWKAIMGTTPSAVSDCDKCPVEQVSWFEAQDFITKLNARTTGRYRLPTEAEWEWAARGGEKSKGYTYAGGEDLNAVGWCENGQETTQPVAKKKPNELGLFDMSGNVCEWCNDWYADDYYTDSPVKNPGGPESGEYRVKRGGSWYYDECRVADRGWSSPTNQLPYNGFRLAHSAR